MAATTRAYIGLGGNVGDARATLERAVDELASLPGARLGGVSPLYRTRPVGDLDQPDFLNAVIELDLPSGEDPARGAIAVLVDLKRLEQELGRQERRRWGPREVDLDLLLFGDARLEIDRPTAGRSASVKIDPGAAARLLEVPHPSMRDRLFVLAPLADLAPDLVPPGWNRPVEVVRTELEAAEPDAVIRAAEWDVAGRRWA